MTSRSSLGEELVENFQLLLQYLPNDDCTSVVNECMLSLPDKRTFQNVMRFVLDILKPDWRSEISDRIITSQDERKFNSMLCDHFKVLRQEFPEVGLPLLSPSSLICFHGERCREHLVKITTCLMLLIMKKENYVPDKEVDKDVLQEYKDLTEECDNLRKQIQQKRDENDEAVSHNKEVLQLVVTGWYWSEDTKRRLLDINDKNIISEILKKKEDSLNELKSLKEKLQPYFAHVCHIYNKIDCLCPPALNLSDEKISMISDLLCEVDKCRISIDIMYLKLISAVKTLKINYAKSINPNIQLDEHVPSALIEKLNNFVSADVDENTSVDIHTLLGCSPVVVDMNSPTADTSRGFTPITHITPIAQNWINIKKKPVKMDLQCFAECMVPTKVCASPINPIPSQIVSDQFEKPKSNETIMSIVERMRSGMSETPNQFGKQRFNYSDLKTSFPSLSSSIAGPPLYGAKSSLKLEKLTPASKSQVSSLSHTTGRRQSMAFVKPANCLVRRQLACTPSAKIPPSTSSKKPESTARTENVDKILDKLVQELVEHKNNESFSTDSSIDDLDLSLSGVECLKSPGAGSEFPIQSNKTNKLGLSATRAEQTSRVLDSVLSEVIEDNRELSVLINSICEDECPNTQDLKDQNQLDVFLSGQELSKILDSQQKPQKGAEIAKKSGRKSLDLLIQRFNAIKIAHQKK